YYMTLSRSIWNMTLVCACFRVIASRAGISAPQSARNFGLCARAGRRSACVREARAVERRVFRAGGVCQGNNTDYGCGHRVVVTLAASMATSPAVCPDFAYPVWVMADRAGTALWICGRRLWRRDGNAI